MSTDDKLIGSIKEKQYSEIRFIINKYKGNLLLNIREYVESVKYTGFTPRGIALKPEIAKSIYDAINNYNKTFELGENDEIIRVAKNSSTIIIVHIVSTQNRDRESSLDIREYVETDTYQGFTKKGIRFSMNLLKEVINLLEKSLMELNLIKNDGRKIEDDKAEYISNNDKKSIFNQVLPEGIPKFPWEYLPSIEEIFDNEFNKFEFPPEQIKIGPRRGNNQELYSDAGFEYLARNNVEAKYIIYSQQQNDSFIMIPNENLLLFKIVSNFEKLYREVYNEIVKILVRKKINKNSAISIAKKIMSENNFIILED